MLTHETLNPPRMGVTSMYTNGGCRRLRNWTRLPHQLTINYHRRAVKTHVAQRESRAQSVFRAAADNHLKRPPHGTPYTRNALAGI